MIPKNHSFSQLSPRMGHSSVAYKDFVLNFGGMKYDQTLLDELIVLHLKEA